MLYPASLSSGLVGVEVADEDGHVDLEDARAQADEEEPDVERGHAAGPGDGQADVAEGHEERSGPDRPDLADDLVAEPAAEKRHEIAEGQEEPVIVALAGVGPAQDLVHVEDEDGHERVEADPFPHLGEEDEGQGAGVFLQHGAAFRAYANQKGRWGQTLTDS